jgi:hypothetical protein
MPSPTTVISRPGGHGRRTGRPGKPAAQRRQRDGRPAVAVVLAETGRPLRSVIVVIQVLTRSGAMLPALARRLA